MNAIDWADAPPWISAVSSMLALTFAAIVAFYARRTFRIESDRAQVAAEERRTSNEALVREQAAHVSAWWENAAQRDGSAGIFIRNGSQMPVFQAHVTVVSEVGAGLSKAHLAVVPPSSSPTFLPLPHAADRGPGGEGTVVEVVERVTLSFTDAAGLRWRRNEHGRLTKCEPRLLIKTDPPRAEVLNQFQSDFREAYGVTLEFDEIHTGITDPLPPLFTSPSRPDGAVDALIGGHDWIGSLAGEGLIESTVLADAHRRAFRSWTLDALTIDGQLYGVPTTLDVPILIRNLDLAPAQPTSMEGLIATGNALKNTGRVRESFAIRVTNDGDPFQLWPLFASAGGSLFLKTSSGAWDPARIDLASRGSIAAFERLRSLGESGDHLLRRSMDKAEAFHLFVTGQTPYLMTTTDGLAHARRAGVRLAVSAVPAFSGGVPARPMSLVHGLFMAKHGRNKHVAHELFSDYLTHPVILSKMAERVGCPVALADVIGADSDGLVCQAICEDSDAMPTFPGMRQVWEIVGRAHAAAIRGADAEQVARTAAEEVALALQTAKDLHG